MRRAALLLGFLPLALRAQIVLPEAEGAGYFARGDLPELKCQVAPRKTALDFSFRFHSGYEVRIPLDQYHGPGHSWTVVLRVQPEQVITPVYLIDRLRLPDLYPTDQLGESAGAFRVGLGRYQISFLLVDDMGRGCRSSWRISTQFGPSDGHPKLAIPPGAVDSVLWNPTESSARPNAARVETLTVLLHAAPLWPQRTRLEANDLVMLQGILSALLNQIPASRVRLVMFNLAQQKELYRSSDFTVAELPALRQAVFDLQLAAIDFHTLQKSPVDLLSRLVEEERQQEKPSDVVIFLGPQCRVLGKAPIDNADTPQARSLHFFYLELQSPTSPPVAPVPGFGPPAGPGAAGPRAGGPPRTIPAYGPSGGTGPHDAIEMAVRSMKGKTVIVATPADFTRAMHEIDRVFGKS